MNPIDNSIAEKINKKKIIPTNIILSYKKLINIHSI